MASVWAGSVTSVATGVSRAFGTSADIALTASSTAGWSRSASTTAAPSAANMRA